MSPAVTSVVLAAIPSPDRGVWHLGPIPIRAYALCIIAGIVIAVVWGERRFVARGGEPGTVTDVAVFAVPFGLVGGRLYHVATDWQTYFGPGGNPIDALKIWQGGLGIWGAIALGAVGAWIGCRRRGVPLPFFADAVAPGIVTAQAVGRLGNWFNQELYGAPTTLPWGLEIYRRVNPDTGAPDSLGGVALDHTPIEVVHPTFLYELLWNLVVAALVVWADRRFRLGHGRAFAVYVAGYTAGRFWIEQMRTDYATRVFGDVRINVVVSAVVFLGAVLYLVLVRKPREVLAVPPVEADEERPVPVAAGAVRSAAGTAGVALEPAPGASAERISGSAGTAVREEPSDVIAPGSSRGPTPPDATPPHAAAPPPTDGPATTPPPAGSDDSRPTDADPDPADQDSTRSAAPEPVAAESDAAESDAAESVAADPAVAKADAAESDAARLDPAESDAAESDVAESDAAESDVAESDVAESDVAEPAVAEPAVAESNAAQSDVATSNAAEPVATESSAAASAASESDADEPDAGVEPSGPRSDGVEMDATESGAAKSGAAESDAAVPAAAESDAAEPAAAEPDATQPRPATPPEAHQTTVTTPDPPPGETRP